MKTYFKSLLAFTAIITACKVTTPYQAPANESTGNFRGKSAPDTNNIAHLSWRSYFKDTSLQKLIAEGISGNLNLQAAMERITIAQASFSQSKKAFLPQASLTAGYRQSRLAYPQGFGFVKGTPQYDIGVNTSWEADIWGKLSSAKKAAYAGLLATEASKDAILTKLIADIAGNYYRLLALDAQLALLQKATELRAEDVETMTLLQHSDVVNGAAVVQSQANEYAAKVAIPIVKKNILQTENALSILLGRKPGNIARMPLLNQAMPEILATGVPAQLLANRPDVRQAEADFRVAFESTNIARTAFYPSLTLSAAAGFSSFSLGDWFTGQTGLFGNVAAGIMQPLYNRGINKARLKTKEAEQRIALNNFKQSLLNAGGEVADALQEYAAVEERMPDRNKQIEALEKSVDFTQTLLRYSTNTNYIDVLTSEQQLLAAQLDRVNDTLEQWLAVINLYHALGGGWR